MCVCVRGWSFGAVSPAYNKTRGLCANAGTPTRHVSDRSRSGRAYI